MSDNITLPREVVFLAVKVFSPMAYDTWPRERKEVVEAFRAALAAPEPDHDAEVEALRRDAERYKWLLNWLVKTGLLYSEYCRIDTPASVGDWWILHKPKVIDGSSVIGHGETANATIDAAMKEPPR